MTIRNFSDIFYNFVKLFPYFLAYTCFIIILFYYRHTTGNVCCIYANHPKCIQKPYGRRWSYDYYRKDRALPSNNKERNNCEYSLSVFAIGTIAVILGLYLILSIWFSLYLKFNDKSSIELHLGTFISFGYFFTLSAIIIQMTYNYIYTEEQTYEQKQQQEKNKSDIREGFINKIYFIIYGTLIYGSLMNYNKLLTMYRTLGKQANIKERGIHIGSVLLVIIIFGTVVNLFVRGQQTETNEMKPDEVNNSFATSYYIIFFVLTCGGLIMFYSGILGREQMFIYYGLVYLLSWGIIEYYIKQKK